MEKKNQSISLSIKTLAFNSFFLNELLQKRCHVTIPKPIHYGLYIFGLNFKILFRYKIRYNQF